MITLKFLLDHMIYMIIKTIVIKKYRLMILQENHQYFLKLICELSYKLCLPESRHCKAKVQLIASTVCKIHNLLR